MRPVKICIIAKYLYPYDTRLNQQVDALEDYNIACDIICGSNGKQDAEEHIKNVSIYRVSKKPANKQSFLVYLFDTFKFLLNTFLKLITLSFANNYKVIVVHTLPEFIVFTTLFNKLFGSVIILDGRDITVDLLASRWRGNRIFFVKLLATMLERVIMGFCDEIITASNGFKRSLVSRGVEDSKITVIVNTADEKIFKYDTNRKFITITEKAQLIYHGTVSERFGLLVAVKAMKSICQKIPGSVLHIFGFFDPAYRNRIEQFISEADLAKNVLLYAPLSLPEIYRHMMTMDMGVVPYLSDDFMNKALSTKTFEYIAAGLPVTASRLKSAEELFNDTCIEYAEPGNYEDLAQKIINMCLNPQLREAKRNKAHEVFTRNFTSSAQNQIFVKMITPYLGKSEVVSAGA
jgi:glycosyltransferase involved in cell wall biosynthesis